MGTQTGASSMMPTATATMSGSGSMDSSMDIGSGSCKISVSVSGSNMHLKNWVADRYWMCRCCGIGTPLTLVNLASTHQWL